MSWHYQIRKRKRATPDGDGFDIVEVYNLNGKEVWTEASMDPFGETREELIADLERMLADAKKYPVLEEPENV